MSQEKLRASKIILVNSENKFLFYLRDNNPQICYPGYWDLIGGESEIGENALDCVKREVMEEIGITARDIVFVGKVYEPEVNTELSLFSGKIDAKVEEIDLREGQMAEYFSLEQIRGLHTLEIFKKAILGNLEKILRPTR